jgi:hypothetical protein
MRARNHGARKGLTDKNFAIQIELLSLHEGSWGMEDDG